MSSSRRHRKLTKPRRYVEEPPVPEPDPQPVLKRRAPMPRLRHFPKKGHLTEDYSDLVDANEIPPHLPKRIYQAMERHLPPAVLGAPRVDKLAFMQRVLAGDVPSQEEFARMESCIPYRQMICSTYKPLHAQLYKMNPHAFFLPSFLRAIRGNTIQSFNDIIHEPVPNVYTFPMFRPAFCEMLMNEVENFEKWAHREKQEINDPNNFHKPSRGTTISDIGMKGMLDDLMQKFISPISKVLFPDVGGRSLDSQHSYVVSYGGDDGGGRPGASYDGYDDGQEIHVEDSHITLNVCLGKQFTHGQMYFFGSRCGNHVNSGAEIQETFLYSHVVGQALLYHGRNRHKVCPTSGFRVNMTMQCKSSLFKEVTKCKIDFPDWCIECLKENNTCKHNIHIS